VIASRIQWNQVKPSVVANEGLQVSLVLFSLAIGALKLPMLLLLWMLELVILTALSSSFYPERGRARALMDVVKIIFLCAFVSIFLILIYSASGGRVRLESWSVLSAAALLALRLAIAARSAKQSVDPKLAWTKAALVRGAVVVIGMFLGVFACFLVGLPLAGALQLLAPDVAPDVGLGVVLLATQIVLVAVLSTMSDAELREIAGNPYID
jgi:hypothetical protein